MSQTISLKDVHAGVDARNLLLQNGITVPKFLDIALVEKRNSYRRFTYNGFKISFYDTVEFKTVWRMTRSEDQQVSVEKIEGIITVVTELYQAFKAKQQAREDRRNDKAQRAETAKQQWMNLGLPSEYTWQYDRFDQEGCQFTAKTELPYGEDKAKIEITGLTPELASEIRQLLLDHYSLDPRYCPHTKIDNKLKEN